MSHSDRLQKIEQEQKKKVDETRGIVSSDLDERYAQRQGFKDAEAVWRRTMENANNKNEEDIPGPSVAELEKTAEKKAAEMMKDAVIREKTIDDLEAQQDLQQKVDERNRRADKGTDNSRSALDSSATSEDSKELIKRNAHESQNAHIDLKAEEKASYQADQFLAEVSKDLQENYKKTLEEQRAAEGLLANAKHRVMDVVDQVINLVEDGAEAIFGGGEDISKTDMQKKAERKVDRHAFVGVAKRAVQQTVNSAKEKVNQNEEST